MAPYGEGDIIDISIYNLKDLILTAMKSEIESENVYSKLADTVKNFMLRDKFQFLAGEEEKHRAFFEWLFKENFPGREIVLPEKTPVPLPKIKIDTENLPLSEIMQSAMRAEKATCDFYNGIADKFDKTPEIKKMLLYIASMEMGHYRILEVEKENAMRFEDFDVEWPMMHVGP